MPLVLGIDSSLTRTGLCHVFTSEFDQGIEIEVRSVSTSPAAYGTTPCGYSRRIDHLVQAIEPWMKGVDLVAIEQLAYAARGNAAFALPWLWGRIIDSAAERKIPVLVVGTSARAKYATGKGNSPKDAVLAAAIRRWPNVDITDNDVADALIVAAIGSRHIGHPVDDVPKSHYVDVMKKLGLPDLAA